MLHVDRGDRGAPRTSEAIPLGVCPLGESDRSSGLIPFCHPTQAYVNILQRLNTHIALDQSVKMQIVLTRIFRFYYFNNNLTRPLHWVLLTRKRYQLISYLPNRLLSVR